MCSGELSLISSAETEISSSVAKPPQLAIAYARELTHLLAMVKRVPAAGLHWVYKPLQRSARPVGYYGGRSTCETSIAVT